MPHATSTQPPSSLHIEPMLHDPKETKVDFGATVTGVDLNEIDREYLISPLLFPIKLAVRARPSAFFLLPWRARRAPTDVLTVDPFHYS